MKNIKRLLCLILSATLTFSPLAGYAAYDPVNDDTDLFLANPNITSQRPNVLLVLDNTANWNTPFTNEKNALVQVVNGLEDGLFNVGLMMMVETGSPNDTTDGGYVRFAVRQMIGTAKTNLASLVNNFHILNDKGNNNTVGYALHEAYLYYAGLTARAGDGKFKTDHDATTDTYLAGLGSHALPGSSGPPAMPNENGVYRSPITDGCQKNFIIYISNGQANENASARAEVEGFLATLTGKSPPDVLALQDGDPTGQQGNWGDEMAKYMANTDIHSMTGTQNVFTYVVEVNPQTSGLGPDMTALMKSVARNGKGRYFGVTDSASGTEIVDALNAIFNEIQDKESVFAATTLPVSANVQGTHVNQVYVGVFRPDANKAPRWLGNLKMYNFAQDSTGVFLADASNGIPPAVGNPAVDTVNTGFIRSDAQSFWTKGSTFWGFRDATENGTGGSSDSPDGEQVEKGGAAQQVRIAAVGLTAGGTGTGDASYITTNRNIYTYTDGGFFAGGCTTNCLLSNTPFRDDNTDINNTALALDVRFVSPLTAFETKTVSSLTDRKSAILSNANNPISVTSLSNGATTRTITNLTTATPKTVTSLTGISGTSNQIVSLSTIAKVSGNTYQATAATTSLPAGYVVDATAVISGVQSNTNLNGSRVITSVSGNTFQFSCPGCGNTTGTGGQASVTAAVETTTATATLVGHGFTNGQSVTISGASPTQFNGTFNITKLSDDSFSYTMSTTGGNATGTILAAGNTTIATATTSAAHGFSAGQSVTISGATEFSGISDGSSYNGTKTILTNPAPTSNTFSYSVGSTALSANTASPVYAVQGGTTTVTVTTLVAHGFADQSTVNIQGSDISGYNGSWRITTAGGTTFTFNTATDNIAPTTAITQVLAANTSTIVTASTGFSNTVTATITGHGFIAGDSITIQSTVAGDPHAGTFTVDTAPDTNTLTYTNAQTVAPSGTYSALLKGGKVLATVNSHGYATGNLVTIAGALPNAYNGEQTITFEDANTFSYVPSSAPGAANTSVSVSASKKTTTARATSTAHGFSDGTQVVIANATPTDFNGTVTISVPLLSDGVTRDPNTFTYTILSGVAQGDASGAVTATQTGSTSTDRTNLINWVRGQDNFEDENSNTSTTDIRASVHGDVLHSRPAVINYARTTGSDNDVFLFYGANDGIFRAVKGGYAVDAATPSIQPGQELWGFIPEEFFDRFNRMRRNSPIISSTFKKNYFMDGPISVYTKDGDSPADKQLGGVNDTANIYIGMRRGGRFYYALDVNDPLNPKYKWKISNGTAGFEELGQTWSEATVVEGLIGQTSPVLIFGGGYDPAVEDIDPSTIPAGASNYTSTGVTTAAGTTNRTMGRAIYVVNALTGALLWSAGGTNSTTSGTFDLTVTGMDFAIPSAITVVKNESGGDINRAYVGDTGGNMWRIDFKDPIANTTITQIASIADFATREGRRKFQNAPDVVGATGFDAILIGSGDREHPLDTGVLDRFYMFKDKGTDAGPATGTTYAPSATPVTHTNPVIVEGALFNATLNCIQDEGAAGCSAAGQGTTSAAVSLLDGSSGWYMSLVSVDPVTGAQTPRGEKVVGNAVTIGGTVFFGTNQPTSTATTEPGVCTSDLGVARIYAVSATDATATLDLNADGTLTGSERSQTLAGGGLPPPATHVVVKPEGGDEPTELVCVGIHCVTPTVPTLNSRLRKYWYKAVDL
jgi:Tfp pilus tip-associated adhesin PilY1